MDATNDGVSINERINNYLLGGEEPQEPQESAEEVEAVDEVQEEIPDEGVEEDGEPLDISYLAQATGLSEDQFIIDEDGVYVRTKTDGEEGRAKFADLLKSYQYEGHLNKKDTALSEKLKQAEQRLVEVDNQAKQRLDQLDDTLRIAYNQLHYEASQIDWQELERDDPNEFLLQRTKLQDRERQLNMMYQKLEQDRHELRAKRVQEASTRIKDLIPDWRDSEKEGREKVEITNYARKIGYTDEEISSIDNPLMVVALRKAMLYDQLQAKKPEVTNKVKKAPKFVKSGVSVQKMDREAADLKDARTAIRKSGGKSGSVAQYLLKKGIV